MIKALPLLFCFQGVAAIAQWTWVGGSSISNAAPVYGTQYVFDPAVTPGHLYAPGQCVDLDGRLWIFGGRLGSSSNDLWCFDPAIEQWAWMGGGQSMDFNGHYGTQGVPSPANRPHARGYCSAMWCDQVGDLWLFGGLFASDDFNDLWRYEIGTGMWTWMRGDSTIMPPGSYGVQGVPALTNDPPGRSETIGTWVADDGSLWMYGGERYPFYTYSDLWRYEPSTNMWTWMHGTGGAPGGATNYGTLNVPAPTNTPGKRCAWTHWKDDGGNFWLFGGMTHGVNLPSSDLWMFDPLTVQWTWKGGPTGTAGTGVFGSQCVVGSGATPPALFEATANWKDGDGRLYFYGGGYRNGTNTTTTRGDIWRYDPALSEWTWVWGAGQLSPVPDHGTLGVPAATNTPGGRMGAAAVAVGDSLVYMYGGFAGDLWKLDMNQLCVSTGVALHAPAPTLWFNELSDQLHVHYAGDAGLVEVYDPAGRLCMRTPVQLSSAGEAIVSVASLRPGLYIVSVLSTSSGGQQIGATRFVRQ